METQDFPKWIYLKKENKAVLVGSAALEARYGEEGVDYASRPWPEGEYEKAAVEINPDCPKCASVAKQLADTLLKFDLAFAEVKREREGLRKQLAETTEGRDKALQQLADANAAKKAEAPKAEQKPDEKKPVAAPAKK